MFDKLRCFMSIIMSPLQSSGGWLLIKHLVVMVMIWYLFLTMLSRKEIHSIPPSKRSRHKLHCPSFLCSLLFFWVLMNVKMFSCKCLVCDGFFPSLFFCCYQLWSARVHVPILFSVSYSPKQWESTEEISFLGEVSHKILSLLWSGAFSF